MLVGIAVLVAGIAYWYFFTGGPSATPSITSTLTPTQTQTQLQSLMSALPASFETSIFDDKRFGALIDISTQVTPESAGRPDPFAGLSASR
jgi:hypothetical protein